MAELDQDVSTLCDVGNGARPHHEGWQARAHKLRGRLLTQDGPGPFLAVPVSLKGPGSSFFAGAELP